MSREDRDNFWTNLLWCLLAWAVLSGLIFWDLHSRAAA